MTRFQRIAFITFILLELVIFAGAAVRATGSGLGCPDWPTCYGRLVPPTRAAQIDFNHLDLEKYRKKAAQHGRDPATVTAESLRAEFNPVTTWIEYLNRLATLPLSVSVLVMLIASFRQRASLRWASVGALLLLLANALLGAKVVLSGLKPGVVTTHMALAIVMLCLLIYATWRAAPQPWTFAPRSGTAITVGWMLFALVVAEGIMGSQVREMTDALAFTHAGQPRSQWVAELEHSGVYLVHRSFPWLIILISAAFAWLVKLRWLERCILGLIGAQVLLGVVLSWAGILAVVQVLHIGLSSLLVSGLFLWLLAARTPEEPDLIKS